MNTQGNPTGWWLRSPGEEGNYAAEVDSKGAVFEFGSNVTVNMSVCPALWIDISKH